MLAALTSSIEEDEGEASRSGAQLPLDVHPERCPGLYTTVGNKQDGELLILDKSYKFPADYKFVLDGKLRSPWYDNECDRSPNEQLIAQELDINYHESGWTFFQKDLLDAYVLKWGRHPLMRGEVDGNISTMTTPFIVPQNGGRLRLWILPNGDDKWDFTNDEFVIGCDIATGKGGRLSSNSSASVFNKRTRSKVAHFWSNSINPIDFAQYCFCLGRFFTGRPKPALIIPEANGPGASSSSNSSANIRTCSSGNRKRSSRRKRRKNRAGGREDGKADFALNYVKELRAHDYQPCIESLEGAKSTNKRRMGTFSTAGPRTKTASTRAKITAIW